MGSNALTGQAFEHETLRGVMVSERLKVYRIVTRLEYYLLLFADNLALHCFRFLVIKSLLNFATTGPLYFP